MSAAKKLARLSKQSSMVLFLTAGLLSLTLTVPTVSTMKLAYAMGDNPTSCSNRYDATVTSVVVHTARQTVNVEAQPSTVTRQKAYTGYDLTITLHTAASSSLGNTNPGTVWYTTSAYGYSLGTCVSSATSNQDIVITLHNVYMGQANPNGITKQLVSIGSWPDTSQVNYRVVWYP